MSSFTLVVAEENEGERLDRFVASVRPKLSRARVSKLIEGGFITINGKKTRPSAKVRGGAVISVTFPPPEPSTLLPENISLEILFEDDEIVVIDKPVGMVVHPAAGHKTGTLANALLAHCGKSLSGIGGVTRPGIVHRLDKETSGVIVAAKNDNAHAALSEQLKSREMSRVYIAVVKGAPKEKEGVIKTDIGRSRSDRKKMSVTTAKGREAVTRYKVAQYLDKISILEVALHTGRTHQIRVHMKHINHPVVGDPVYSRGVGKFPINRQALHAWRITFIHPVNGESMTLTAKLPDDMATLIESAGGDISPYR